MRIYILFLTIFFVKQISFSQDSTQLNKFAHKPSLMIDPWYFVAKSVKFNFETSSIGRVTFVSGIKYDDFTHRRNLDERYTAILFHQLFRLYLNDTYPRNFYIATGPYIKKLSFTGEVSEWITVEENGIATLRVRRDLKTVTEWQTGFKVHVGMKKYLSENLFMDWYFGVFTRYNLGKKRFEINSSRNDLYIERKFTNLGIIFDGGFRIGFEF